MNKEQLEGYLLACCDSIDRLIETGKLKKDDLAGKLAENLREYIALNSNRLYDWYRYPIYTTTEATKLYCYYCGKELKYNEIHNCKGWTVTYSSDGTK